MRLEQNFDIVMKEELFTTAIKDGKYIYINKFESGVGADCDCICPKCGEPVISNVTKKKSWELKRAYTNHFSHFNEFSSCFGGHGETELHLYAKEILLNNRSLTVPSKSGNIELKYEYVVSEKAFRSNQYKQYRPDIILYDSEGTKTAVEIVVTNPVSAEKTALYEKEEIRCLKIDLGYFHGKDIKQYKNQIDKAILQSVSFKEWIWTDAEEIEEVVPQKSKQDVETIEESVIDNHEVVPNTKQVTSEKWWQDPFVIGAGIVSFFFIRKKVLRFLRQFRIL